MSCLSDSIHQNMSEINTKELYNNHDTNATSNFPYLKFVLLMLYFP